MFIQYDEIIYISDESEIVPGQNDNVVYKYNILQLYGLCNYEICTIIDYLQIN